MQGQPGSDRDWEHWPGRRPPDDRIRHRLRSLFAPTDHVADDVEALIAERGRELEERTQQLAATIADLERREESTRRLRIAVEEMLRLGSVELDDRNAELNALAAELAERDGRVAAAADDVEERRRELGAVELRRAAVERREAAAEEREQELGRAATEVEARRRELDAVAAEMEARLVGSSELEQALAAERELLDARQATLADAVAELEARVHGLTAAQASLAERELRVADLEERARMLARREAELDARERQHATDHEALEAGREELARAVATVSSGLGLPEERSSPDAGASSHLRLVPGERYHLDEATGPPPQPGSVVEIGGSAYGVLRVGPSPFPGDLRRCVFFEPVSR